jgi:predicted dehydrogenase
VKDAQKVLNTAKVRGKFLSVAMHCRYRPEIKYLYENIQGKIVYFKQIYHENWMSASSWYFDPKISGGGVLLDVGINQLDWILPLIEGLELQSASFEQADCKVELDCHLEWKYGAGRGVTDLTWRSRKEKKLTVIETDRGEVFELDHQKHSIYLNGSLKGQWLSYEYQEVIQDFIRQKEDCEKENHSQNGRSYQLIKLLHSIYESCGFPFLGKQFSHL